ncbi:MAG: hypothetical protein ACOCVF_01195 [bacterium]
MRIDLYIRDENNNEQHIHTFHDQVSNPFKVGDIIHLTVEEHPPKYYENFSYELKKSINREEEEKKKTFHLKDVKLYEEGKYLEITKGDLIIEYLCKFVD